MPWSSNCGTNIQRVLITTVIVTSVMAISLIGAALVMERYSVDFNLSIIALGAILAAILTAMRYVQDRYGPKMYGYEKMEKYKKKLAKQIKRERMGSN